MEDAQGTTPPLLVVDSQNIVATAASASSSQAMPSEGSSADMCLACKKQPIEYCPAPCGHPIYCKKCAMKCATGGKCKTCGGLFPHLRRI